MRAKVDRIVQPDVARVRLELFECEVIRWESRII